MILAPRLRLVGYLAAIGAFIWWIVHQVRQTRARSRPPDLGPSRNVATQKASAAPIVVNVELKKATAVWRMS